ncbi:hypothetical protein OAB57_00485 [Bacteriovoracaceae bacterium]|nr:hypothetical protein [Bacteriovoracaceae bacterium]
MITTNTSHSKSYLQQVIILLNTSSILVIILVFCVWLYSTEKEAVGVSVNKDVVKMISITKNLSILKKENLNILAQKIAGSTMYRSALFTSHEGTIVDTLESIVAQNGLDFVLVVEKKRILYAGFLDKSHTDVGIKKLVHGTYIGVAKTFQDGKRLLIGSKLTNKEIDGWSKITGAKYVSFKENNEVIISNLDSKALESYTPSFLNGKIQVTPKGNHYGSYFPMIKNTLHLYVFVEKNPYWIEFTKKRNSLILLGSILFFIGLLMSTLLSMILKKIITGGVEGSDLSEKILSKILHEIESYKNKGEEQSTP